MLKPLIPAALAVVSLCSPYPALADPLDWQRYVEGEHDCRLEYPTALFVRPEDTNSVPQLFTGPNEDTYFRIMAADNTSQWTPADIKAKYLQSGVPGEITYERTKGEFLVLSGYRGKSIFYTKVSMSDDERTACILEITYPRADKRQFDLIVTRMSRSFSARS